MTWKSDQAFLKYSTWDKNSPKRFLLFNNSWSPFSTFFNYVPFNVNPQGLLDWPKEFWQNLHPTMKVYSQNPLPLIYISTICLKLPSLLAAWLFLTFHIKSHNIKALVILSHSQSPFLQLTCLYGKKWTFVGLCEAFWSIFLEK